MGEPFSYRKSMELFFCKIEYSKLDAIFCGSTWRTRGMQRQKPSFIYVISAVLKKKQISVHFNMEVL